MRLKNKSAVVTGGGSGIGRDVALAFAREGAQVLVADLNLKGAEATVAKIVSAGGHAHAVATDVSSESQVKEMAANATSRFGRIDVLGNFAGITYITSILDTTVEQWDRMFAINLRGTFLCMQAVAQVMVKQGSGSIINTSSICGFMGTPGYAAYCSSKAGVILLTKTAAGELGPRGIRVNALAPGAIDTPMHDSLPASTPDALARKVAAIPMRRVGSPEDVSGPAVFLASDESAYVSGLIMSVDGGRSAGLDLAQASVN